MEFKNLYLETLIQKREKPKKGTKNQRTEKHDIRGVVIKAKLQIWNVRIIEIINQREDIETQQEIRVSYGCVIKLNYYF